MKLCRFQPLEFASADIARAPHESHPHMRHGIIEANSVHEFSGELWGARERTGQKWPLDSVKLLPPAIPSKIVCVGKNYVDHAAEMGGPPPKNPIIFLKPPSAVIAPHEPIILPRISQRVDYEGEIAIVIGRQCKHVAKDEALSYVAGITLANEGTIRDWTRHGQFNVTQGKNFDATGAIGPWIETDFDLTKPLHLTVRKNGEITQEDTTASMVFSFADIITYTTSFMTLKAGDVICTGTPVKKAGKSDPPVWLKPGDTIEVESPEVGVLRNSVVDEA